MAAPEVKHECYEPNKVEAIYQNLLAKQNAGLNPVFEICVDNFPVVQKGNNLERFMDYAEAITPATEVITVFVFRKNNQSDKYFFHLSSEWRKEQPPKEALSGTDNRPILADENLLKAKVEKDVQYDFLLKENERLKKKIGEYEEEIEDLYREVEDTKQGRNMQFHDYLDIGKGFFMKMMQDPSKQDLSGVNNNQPNNQSTFKRKGEVQDVDPEPEEKLSAEEKEYLEIFKELKENIGDVEFGNVLHLFDFFLADPTSVSFAINKVSRYINSKKVEPNNNNDAKI